MNTPVPPSTRVTSEPLGKSISARLTASAGWPLRRLLAGLLRNVTHGTLTVELPDGTSVEGRGKTAGASVSIRLHRWRPLLRLLLRGDLGFAESYRDGDWSTPDLTGLLVFCARNDASWGGTLDASWPFGWLGRIFHRARANTRRGSRENISFHYDMGNNFYAQWLDEDLIYSSGLYTTGRETLEHAQSAKLARIIALLDLDGDSKVLEIGCGWGALALALAQGHGAAVTGLTLSSEQLAHAHKRVEAAGLQKQIDLRLQDYRDVDGQYDRIVSIEMLEAVGERYWPTYFETLRQRLKADGTAVLQVITISDDSFEHYRHHTDFIQRFIFPGGMLPSVTAMHEQARCAGLVMVQAESFGLGYAATLAEWRHRFLRAWPTIAGMGFDANFRRLWEYYLCYCEAGFRTGRVDVGLFTLKHASVA